MFLPWVFNVAFSTGTEDSSLQQSHVDDEAVNGRLQLDNCLFFFASLRSFSVNEMA